MLRIENVVIEQGDFRLCADWSLEKGAKLAIIGPSGEGKTTLLSAIAGFVPISSGRIFLDETELTLLPPEARPVSFLFQEHNLFPHMTIAQNVGLGLRPDLRLDGAQKRAVSSVLDRVGLAGMEQRKPAKLSGGQRQRVAIARALLRDKPILMLDEPFAALGPGLKDEMLDLLDGILAETGASLIMVSHDPNDAQRIAEVTSLVVDGVAAVPVKTKALFENPPPALKSYLGTRR